MKQILFLFFLLFLSRREDLHISVNNDLIKSLDIEYTKEKIKILRKIATYFPEELIPAVNKSILITEKIISLQQVATFISTDEPFSPVKSTYVGNNKERLNNILSILKKEMPDDNIKSVTSTMEIILNMDKYKEIISTLNKVSSNPEKLNNVDNLIDLMEPFMDGKTDEQKSKLIDIAKMFNAMKSLEYSSKTKGSKGPTPDDVT